MRFSKEQFLQHLSRFGSAEVPSLERLALRHAAFMEVAPASLFARPVDVADFPALLAWRMSSTKEGQRRGLSYAEGFASVEGIPVPSLHAWCVSPGGVVIDPSWPHGEHYFGFVLNRDWAGHFLPSLHNGVMGRYSDSPILHHPAEAWLVPHPATILGEIAS